MTHTTHGQTVRQAILDAGLALWRSDGPQAVSARRIASQLGMTHGNVRYHTREAATVSDAVAVEAVRVACPVVVPQLIACRHAAVADMAADERRAWMAGAG